MGPHISGYVLDRGELHGITESRGVQDYHKAVPIGGELEVTDVRGKTDRLTCSTRNCCYWAPYPSNTYLQAFMRVHCDSRSGYGVQQLGLSRAYLTRHRDAIKLRY